MVGAAVVVAASGPLPVEVPAGPAVTPVCEEAPLPPVELALELAPSVELIGTVALAGMVRVELLPTGTTMELPELLTPLVGEAGALVVVVVMLPVPAEDDAGLAVLALEEMMAVDMVDESVVVSVVGTGIGIGVVVVDGMPEATVSVVAP